MLESQSTRRLVSVLALGVVLAGCGRNEPPKVEVAAGETPAPAMTGEQVYGKYCAQCHMADGSGVPNFQPPLRGSPIVAGDPAKLEAVIRGGSAALAGRENEYGSPMPPFGMLTDAEVKATVEYVRGRFGGKP